MKKIALTLIILIICLGAASALFSFFEKATTNSLSDLHNQSNKQLQLPSSKDTYLTASLNSNFIPIRNWSIPEPEINVKAAGVFDIAGNKFIYQKNIKEKLPIASLTKIITAIVALENLKLEDEITVSQKAVMTEGENGRLIIGEKLNVLNLLYIMLIESSNDAAIALLGANTNFMDLMNNKVSELHLKDTHFTEPTGISEFNYSTVYDLTQIAKYSMDKPLIWQILGIKETDIYSQDKKTKHHLINTNKLLAEIPEMIGGKTGFTDEAGGCMITMVELQNKVGEYLITVVLGSDNRELSTKKLIEWIQKAYVW